MTARGAKVGILVCALLQVGCLPAEDRPEPGRAEVRASVEPAGAQLITEDGWQIHVDELFASIGNVWLDRDSMETRCEPYSGTLYLRVVDLLRGPALLATRFARGECAMRFQLMGPGDQEVITDVDDEIVRAMRMRASDGFVDDGSVALRAAGTATRGDAVYRFAWRFRQAFDYDPCVTIAFDPERLEVVHVRARIGTLFQEPAGGPLRFDPFAAADADGDLEITLEELGARGEQLYFEAVPNMLWVEDQPPCFVGAIEEAP